MDSRFEARWGVIIDDRIQYDSYTDDTQLAICSMGIYFARPDSNIHGVNVHTAHETYGCPIGARIQAWSEYRGRCA